MVTHATTYPYSMNIFRFLALLSQGDPSNIKDFETKLLGVLEERHQVPEVTYRRWKNRKIQQGPPRIYAAIEHTILEWFQNQFDIALQDEGPFKEVLERFYPQSALDLYQ